MLMLSFSLLMPLRHAIRRVLRCHAMFGAIFRRHASARIVVARFDDARLPRGVATRLRR